MKNSTLIYYEMEEIKRKYTCNSDCQVVIWGTGAVSEEVTRTLEYFSIPVYAYGNSTIGNEVRILNGREVLSDVQTASLPNPFVIIGSFVVRPIYDMLHSLGIKHIYAIIDTIKYSLVEFKKDRQWVSRKYAQLSRISTGSILIEVYGNIGDVIIKLGIIAEILSREGSDKIHFLVESEDIASVIRLLSKNVLVLEKDQFLANENYRRQILEFLNENYFAKILILCDIRLHANRRILNRYLVHCDELCYHNYVPDREYLPQLDSEFIQDCMEWQERKDYSPKKRIDSYIIEVADKLNLPNRFVVVNMGATKEVRHYSPKKFNKVIQYLRQREWEVVMIGYGTYDEEFYEQLDSLVRTDVGIHSFIGKLSVLESFAVIKQAAFFVGTDSGMWNASYILDKPSVVLYGGGEYGNFRHEDSRIHYVTVEDKHCFWCRWFCTNQTREGYAYCIDSISPEMIIEGIEEIIGGK